MTSLTVRDLESSSRANRLVQAVRAEGTVGSVTTRPACARCRPISCGLLHGRPLKSGLQGERRFRDPSSTAYFPVGSCGWERMRPPPLGRRLGQHTALIGAEVSV